jgi:hypothetical protein
MAHLKLWDVQYSIASPVSAYQHVKTGCVLGSCFCCKEERLVPTP